MFTGWRRRELPLPRRERVGVRGKESRSQATEPRGTETSGRKASPKAEEGKRAMPKDLRSMSKDELFGWIQGGAQLGSEMYRAAEQELMRRSVSEMAVASERVRDEVRRFNRCSTFLSSTMIVLTIAIAVLTYLL